MVGVQGRSGGDRKTQSGDMFPRDGLPKPPKGMTKDERETWKQLLGQLPAEMLRGVDCHQLATLAECIVAKRRLKRAIDKDPLDLHLHRAWLQTAQHLDKLSRLFGLTPKDRQSIKFEKVVHDDATEWMNDN